ncbi:hypothetical protein G4B88_024971 [Cannabis sativa]|uniref:Uncharacterized protein n=1 Tax=Cannabis sativa TaxID=3483 RepID=A0A7J6EBW8_CANSA|nr:hypothetical protein G4B88_024971 [Cannabis sativa]
MTFLVLRKEFVNVEDQIISNNTFQEGLVPNFICLSRDNSNMVHSNGDLYSVDELLLNFFHMKVINNVHEQSRRIRRHALKIQRSPEKDVMKDEVQKVLDFIKENLKITWNLMMTISQKKHYDFYYNFELGPDKL